MPKELTLTTTTLYGRPDQVVAALATQRRLGLLVTHPDDIRMVSAGGGRVTADITLIKVDGKPARRRDESFRPILLALTFALGVMAVPAGLIAALILSVGAAAFFGFIATALVLAAVAFGMRFRSSACPGVTNHCPPAHHR